MFQILAVSTATPLLKNSPLCLLFSRLIGKSRQWYFFYKFAWNFQLTILIFEYHFDEHLTDGFLNIQKLTFKLYLNALKNLLKFLFLTFCWLKMQHENQSFPFGELIFSQKTTVLCFYRSRQFNGIQNTTIKPDSINYVQLIL